MPAARLATPSGFEYVATRDRACKTLRRIVEAHKATLLGEDGGAAELARSLARAVEVVDQLEVVGIQLDEEAIAELGI